MMTTRLILIVIAMAAAVAGIKVVYDAGRRAEQLKFIERIEKENRDAGAAAEDWRADYRRCVDGGGLFNFETGACQR